MTSGLALAEPLGRCRVIPKSPPDFRSTTPRRLPRAKAVTIGIGFRCVDGVVLCADNQITFPGSHKFYERKLYQASGKDNEWQAGFTFAGTLDLMKNFYENFVEAMQDAKPPVEAATIKNVIKGFTAWET